MMWLTWRQFRVAALSVFAGLAVICVVLAITGPDLVGRTDFSDQETLFYGGLFALLLLPATLGVFWGVPLVARELEAGTHNLVWNQTVTRTRWLATKLGIGVVAVMVAAGILSLAVSWWASPIDALANLERGTFRLPRVSPPVFVARGIVPIGYAAFAFVLGVAVGMLLRRTLAAMAVTLVVFAAVQVAMPFLVRPYLMPATDETVTITADNIEGFHAEQGPDGDVLQELVIAYPTGTWLLANETVDKNGTTVDPLPAAARDCLPSTLERGKPPDLDAIHECLAQLSDAGYRQRLVYHPDSHFWPLQWAETGVFLALSGLLTWFCFRRLRSLS